MRKLLLMGLVLSATALLGVHAAVAQSTMKTEVGEGEGQLNIIAWPGYIESGKNDANYDWVTQFEKDTGCMVQETDAQDSDSMLNLMKDGGYDLVTASGDSSLRLVYGEYVQPINLDLIPSWKNVDERLQNAPWHTVDKDGDGTPEHYGVPYQWGPNVLMYNTDVFKDAPTSWDVVFKEQMLPDGKSNKGRIEAYHGPIYIADAALYLMATSPDLKITDPYELDQKQFDAVMTLLRSQHDLVARYWPDATSQVNDFTSEGIVASTSWPYQVNLLQLDKKPVASVIPTEGATGWSDTTMMYINAEHPNCAYKWLEHSIDPKVQGDVAAWFGSVPSVPAACKGNELLTDTGCATNGSENFDKLHFWKTPVAACGDDRGDVCIPYSDWTTAYIDLLGGR